MSHIFLLCSRIIFPARAEVCVLPNRMQEIRIVVALARPKECFVPRSASVDHNLAVSHVATRYVVQACS